MADEAKLKALLLRGLTGEEAAHRAFGPEATARRRNQAKSATAPASE